MKFTCFSLNPIGLAHCGNAISTNRVGGVGILDREFCLDNELDLAQENLDKLLELSSSSGGVGLRLKAEQINTSKALLAKISLFPHWLIVSGENLEFLQFLPVNPLRQLLIEIVDIRQLEAIETYSKTIEITGLVARGNESGGWVSEDSAFILAQKLLAEQSLPVIVQGGIGVHTAAACRAAGALGVILDDQLWLMPESPLPTEGQQYLTNLSGSEAVLIGERLNARCRVLSRPGFKVIHQLQQLAEQVDQEPELAKTWPQQAQSLIGWGTPGLVAYPMGQAVSMAARLRSRYQTTGKFVQAILQASLEQIETAQSLQPLSTGSPLATAHKTHYPIVQGPMTRVSDTAEFAHAVALEGGLPLLALALMKGTQVKELLAKTQQLLGTKSWGVGLLGFASQALRAEQINELKQCTPPFALIAGGRPDQAAQLEAMGIATYIHVPTPGLLKLFLEQRGKRFVFEGRECGGHVGPLSSFVLWENAIAAILEVPKEIAGDIHILFAGGIHDARSAAMVSAMASPLAALGVKVGVLMGTAYLFTNEAVACGAIAPEFQNQAIACTQTINLETGPGHASRCVLTPFATEFYETRRQMIADGRDSEDVKNALEDLTLGRLRIASKGLMRDENSLVVNVGVEKQINDGMYMIGQVATLQHQVGSVRALHEQIAKKSCEFLNKNLADKSVDTVVSQPSDIAIVGISTLLPRSQNPEQFWQNIIQKVDAITEIPLERWDLNLYYDPDPQAKDKVYSKWGGFIDDVAFDPLRYGIPPKALKSIEPAQLLALEAVRRALEDAGYADGNFDKENTSVILGAGGGIGDLGGQYATRAEIFRVVDNPSPEVWQRLPEWTEESFPGLLLNVLAGRVANRFDLGGSNFTVDAACASSLAAIDLAVKELETGRSNVVIAGGVDTGQSPFAYLCFSKTQALSPRGKSRSFDKTADGIAISEGIAMVVLKRLKDAQRDGDRIYAVIKSVAGSSDGKGLGMTAPRPIGQMRALQRAYRKAGFSPNTLGMYEAHGTGTVAGDRAELETTLTTLKAENAAVKSCAIGSVKTAIGHTKSSAGIAGLIKVALALHHKVLPPHLNVTDPLEPITLPDSPVYLLKEARPWLNSAASPRRGGVSAFGFGGTNFHAVLEEHTGEFKQTAPGAKEWSRELLVMYEPSYEALVKEVTSLLTAIKAGAEPRLADLAYSYALKSQNQVKKVCLTIVVSDLQQLTTALELVLSNQKLPSHIQLNNNLPSSPQVAFLFPGQGAQYPNMVREAALYFKEIRASIETADRQLQPCFDRLLSQFIYPPSSYNDEQETLTQKLLMDTQIAQPAIGAIEAGFMDLMRRLKIAPSMVCGHSYGEYAALHCAGVLERADFFQLSATRGRVMAEACAASIGAMAAVQTTREDLLDRLQGTRGVVIANQNAPLQCVISGDKPVVTKVVERLNNSGIVARLLPVAGAFHSVLVASAQSALIPAIALVKMQSPRIPVYANSTALPYDSDVEAIRGQLSKQLLSPVQFMSQINAMYADGAKVFVELGPKNILTNLVGQILASKEHTAVSLDGQGGGMEGLLSALGILIKSGVDMQLTALFAGRDVQQLNLANLAASTRKLPNPPTTWMINGGSARPISEEVGYSGSLPPLTQKTANQAAANKHNKQISEPIAPKSSLQIASPHPTTSLPTPSMNSQQQPANRPAMPADTALAAYQAYQETMRQFLSVQEQVMKQFLGAAQVGYAPHQVRNNGVIAPANGANGHSAIAPANGTNGHNAIAPANGANHYSSNSSPTKEMVATPSAIINSPPVVPPSPITISPSVAISPPPVAPIQEIAVAAPVMDREGLTQALLKLVGDRTGYPVQMLGLDQDMEAELGIDSIKRVEIFGSLQKNLPEPFASDVRDRMDSFTRIKTLNQVVEALLKSEGDSLGKSQPSVSVSLAT
ncbi:MAG: acyltransferase domain-containing protein [Chroococcus sp. CMT-3BRIN-NPC107]|jgi:acyl transferase domain-containing protein/NAD(P)H-dependent flavin oxidoreductase YrpB (nitropropane dioxygenase family)|nr:acyltransferase domain-containing protein [Chroococcus sp. CMT-3BRIN-NPC107]